MGNRRRTAKQEELGVLVSLAASLGMIALSLAGWLVWRIFR